MTRFERSMVFLICSRKSTPGGMEWRYSRVAPRAFITLVNKSRQIRTTSQLGSNIEYWGACAQIVMRTQIAMTEERLPLSAA